MREHQKVTIQHRFGSVHTRLKLEIIGEYLPAYTTALKNFPFTLHYIDAFAGTGYCDIQVGGNRLVVPGSASIAIGCTPVFHKMIFIEKSPRKVRALERLKAATPKRDITIVRDDANIAIAKCLSTLYAHEGDRAIIFLDPFGMQVDWATLERIAKSEISDLWYLFPFERVLPASVQARRNHRRQKGGRAHQSCRNIGMEIRFLLT